MKMRKRLAAVAAILLGLVSCQTENGFQTDYVRMDEPFRLEEDAPVSLHVKMEVEYVTDGMKAEVKEAVNEVISEAVFGAKTSGLPMEEAARSYAEERVSVYREANSAYLEEEGFEFDEFANAAMNWEVILDGSFLSPCDHYVSYLVEEYVYQGGAHGLSTRYPVVFDLQTGKVVIESEVFVDGYKEELSRLLTENLHDSFENEEDYDCLFTKDIEPNEHFYVTPKGVTYIYGAYEIGPYYLGNIEVDLSWEELEGLVRE